MKGKIMRKWIWVGMALSLLGVVSAVWAVRNDQGEVITNVAISAIRGVSIVVDPTHRSHQASPGSTVDKPCSEGKTCGAVKVTKIDQIPPRVANFIKKALDIEKVEIPERHPVNEECDLEEVVAKVFEPIQFPECVEVQEDCTGHPVCRRSMPYAKEDQQLFTSCEKCCECEDCWCVQMIKVISSVVGKPVKTCPTRKCCPELEQAIRKYLGESSSETEAEDLEEEAEDTGHCPEEMDYHHHPGCPYLNGVPYRGFRRYSPRKTESQPEDLQEESEYNEENGTSRLKNPGHVDTLEYRPMEDGGWEVVDLIF